VGKGKGICKISKVGVVHAEVTQNMLMHAALLNTQWIFQDIIYL